jgi:hypothetical protein
LTINNTFPATATVGLVARNKVITDGAQQRFTVAMYAQESIKVVQQTLVVGGAVTQEFDAGSQVPTILYTPNLSEYLPKFMPGGRGNGVALTDVSWIRR